MPNGTFWGRKRKFFNEKENKKKRFWFSTIFNSQTIYDTYVTSKRNEMEIIIFTLNLK